MRKNKKQAGVTRPPQQHTPGPWRVAPYYKHEVVSDHGVICCAPMETGQSRINAQLIAAVPELLLALENLLDFAKRTCPDQYLLWAGPAVAAIAKAKGK